MVDLIINAGVITLLTHPVESACLQRTLIAFLCCFHGLYLYSESYFNRPFPSSKKSHFQNETKCEAIDMKMIFNYYANRTHFHNKGFALSLVLKVRFFGTRKWPI